MNLDNLRAELTDLAGEVQPADLRDRALQTSRRIARTRLALVAAATVMVVAVTSAGLALGGGRRALPEIATTPNPSAPAPATPPAGVSSAVYIDDLLFQSPVTVWSASGRQRIKRAWPGGSDPGENAIRSTLTVSPDGTRLSWAGYNALHVMNIAGAGAFGNDGDITLESENQDDQQVYGGCVWSPDSTRLLAGTRNPDELGWITGWFTLADRSFVPADTGDVKLGCGTEINGDWAAAPYQPRLDEISIAIAVWNTRTGERRDVLDGQFGVEVTGVSPDGARVAVRIAADYVTRYDLPERNRQGTFLFDTRTSERLPLDTGGRAVRQLFFQPNGDLVARVANGDHNNLLIFASDGRLLSDASEPPELLESVLLRLITP